MNNAFYIPYHCVSKLDRPNTIRIVFDASAQPNLGSLNDHLFCAPQLQRNIVSIVLNFLLHPVVFTNDVKGMVLQILVGANFRLTRFFLANRELIQLIKDGRFMLYRKILENDVFMDDICSRSDTGKRDGG